MYEVSLAISVPSGFWMSNTLNPKFYLLRFSRVVVSIWYLSFVIPKFLTSIGYVTAYSIPIGTGGKW